MIYKSDNLRDSVFLSAFVMRTLQRQFGSRVAYLATESNWGNAKLHPNKI